MIMDLFFQNAPIKEKRRLHFHDFMKEVHQRILEKSKKENNQRLSSLGCKRSC